jgi:tetratricopeptide (TPR) repeat protein
MKVTWTIPLLTALTTVHAPAQSVTEHVPTDTQCVELNRTVVNQFANGQDAAAETLLSAAIGPSADRNRDTCAGFVLNNMTVLLSASGRIAEAERLAERSVKILEAMYPPDDLVLLRPLSALAATRFEGGKSAQAREVFKRILLIRAERPEDRALIHATAAVLLEAEGRQSEAEAEYLVTSRAWQEAGREETADAGAVFTSLGSLYVKEHRFEEARQALDHALTIFSRARDAFPTDSIRVFSVRGVLQALQGAWLEAEQDLSKAFSIADREPWVDPIALRSLLTSYAYVLRRNHHRREARTIEARAAGIRLNPAMSTIVDVTDLLAKPKHLKK